MKKKIEIPTTRALYFKSERCWQCHYFSLLVASKCKAEGVEYVEVDADKDADMVSKYGVRSVPFVVLIKNGVEIARGHAGYIVKEIRK